MGDRTRHLGTNGRATVGISPDLPISPSAWRRGTRRASPRADANQKQNQGCEHNICEDVCLAWELLDSRYRPLCHFTQLDVFPPL